MFQLFTSIVRHIIFGLRLIRLHVQIYKILQVVVLLSLSMQYAFSQNKELYNTRAIDSLIALKAYQKADSVLTHNINNLEEQQLFLELTRRIYYVGKISLHLNDKATAIKKANDFANSITEKTDSLSVSRQKHLVLARFYVYLKDYKEAAKQNSLALDVTKKMSNATGDLFGLIHHNLSIDNRRLGNINEAIWHSKKSLEYYLSYPKSDKSKVLDAYNSLGARMWDVYKIDSALFYFKKGEKIIDELEPLPMNTFYHRAKAQSNISSAYSQLGNISEASKYNEKAIKNYNAFVNSESDKDFFKEEARLFMFLTIQNYADNFIVQGNYTKARDLNEYVYEQQLKHMPDNDYEISYSLLNLGNIYLKLKDHHRAETYFDKGLEISLRNEQQNKLGVADAFYYKGIINDYYGNIEDAKTNYELSKARYESIFGKNYDEFYLNAMKNYSRFYSENGYHDKAIEMAQNAYDYVERNQGKTTIVESSQLLNLAKIYFKASDFDNALKHINKALDLYSDTDIINSSQINDFSMNLDKPSAILLKSKIVLGEHDKKDPSVLKTQYQNLKQAISILEHQKSIITEDENLSVILEDNNDLFEYAKQVCLWLYQATKEDSYLEEILSLHESKLYNRIRQQLNVNTKFSSSDIPTDVLDKESNLIEQLKQSLTHTDNIESFIETNAQWDNFLASLKEDYPKYYNLKYASIAKAFELNNVIKEGHSVLRYMYIYNDLFAFVIEDQKLHAIQLDTDGLSTVLKGFNSEQLDQNVASYHNLYRILWKPIESLLSNEKIVIIPDGNLFNLSFEAFVTQETSSNKTLHKYSLLRRYCISYNYSLLLINKHKAPQFFEKNFIAFSPEFNDEMKNDYRAVIQDSVFIDKSYLRLLPQPFATNIAEEFSKVFDGTSFLNENASKDVFTKEAREHKIIHIGTHAESNNISPELSRLIFAKRVNDSISAEDNSLYTYEIYNQNLSSNLAILTACETGKPSYQSGEGMISLAHAFNYAGSESMLTSLWKIDEQSSAKIIANFYKHLKAGLPKDKALQNAKLDYMSTAEGRTLAPQYWAGLVLIGDTSPIALKTKSSLPFWMSIATVFLILFIVFFRKKRASI